MTTGNGRESTDMKRAMILACLAIFAVSAQAQAQDKKVMAIRSSALPLYSQSLDGLRKCLKSGASVVDAVLPEAPAQADAFIEEVKAKRPDVIVTFGSSATRIAREKIKSIPVVFCM